MSRKYTAQGMREMASTIEDKRVICSVENSGDTDDRGLEIYYHESHYGECLTVAAMLRQAADMMERESTREKSSRAGNAAKMRDALLLALVFANGMYNTTKSDEYLKLAETIEAAISAPPRNCDAFSKAQVLEMLEDRSFSKEDTTEWLFDEAKGENDGSR